MIVFLHVFKNNAITYTILTTNYEHYFNHKLRTLHFFPKAFLYYLFMYMYLLYCILCLIVYVFTLHFVQDE